MTRAPGQPLRRTAQDLVAEANSVVPPVAIDDALPLLDDTSVLFVDIREQGELEKLGVIPGAYRAPRGMLEFWVDPASPYYRKSLDDGRRLVLYCGSAWRSALAAAALHEMGRTDVTHLDGGFSAWSEAGHPVEPFRPR
ncbi:rhodanese-like domain-containing protein [Tessaracoccus sp. Y36]